MKCWFCKESDFEQLERNKVEEILSKALPLRPYKCNSCEKKFFGPTDPLFDKNRKIAAGVMGGLLVLMLAFTFIGGGEEEEQPENTPPPPPTLGSMGEPIAIEEEPEEEEEEGQEAPQKLPHSDFVLQRVARNKAIRAGEEPPKVPEKKAKTTQTPKSPKNSSNSTNSKASRLTALRSAEENGVFVLHLTTDNPVEKYGSFLISGGTKIVVDLKGSWQKANAIKNQVPINHAMVAQVRFGSHKDHLRLVLDLKQTYGKQPQISKEATGLKIALPL